MNRYHIAHKHKLENLGQEVLELYVNKQVSMNRICNKFSLNRDSIAIFLKSKNVIIRPRKFYLLGDKNSNYKGGHITRNGYRRISLGNGKQILEHRVVIEGLLGRKLTKHEHVHHLNGNKQDNRVDNLSLLTSKKHGELHAKEYRNQREMYQSRIAFLESIGNKCSCSRNQC